MPFINAMMRIVTHLNIGAAIALFAWILCSSQQTTGGDMPAAARALPMPSLEPSAATTWHTLTEATRL